MQNTNNCSAEHQQLQCSYCCMCSTLKVHAHQCAQGTCSLELYFWHVIHLHVWGSLSHFTCNTIWLRQPIWGVIPIRMCATWQFLLVWFIVLMQVAMILSIVGLRTYEDCPYYAMTPCAKQTKCSRAITAALVWKTYSHKLNFYEDVLVSYFH